MKRFTRTVVSGVVGLILGWYVAGIVPGLTVSRAQDTGGGHAQGVHEGQSHAGNHAADVHPGHIGHESVGDDHHGTVDAAPMLVPQAEDLSWFRPVVGVAVVLFVAAIVVGILHRPAPTEPVADAGHDH